MMVGGLHDIILGVAVAQGSALGPGVSYCRDLARGPRIVENEGVFRLGLKG